MIDSLNNQKIKEYNKLKQKKYRDRTGLFLLEGEDLIRQAIEKGMVEVLFSTREDFDFPVTLVSERVAQKLSDNGGESIAVCRKFDYPKTGFSRMVILDDLQDPTNLGLIIKLCDRYEMDGLIASRNTTDFYAQKVIEKAGSSFFKVPFYKCDLEDHINDLKEKGVRIYSTGLRNESVELKQLIPDKEYAIVMGNEGSGVSEKIMDLSDEIIKIDMHNIDSLNVSVACAIVLNNLRK